MRAEQTSKRGLFLGPIILIAVAFFAIRAINYALIGSIFPACFAVLIICLAALWYTGKGKLKRWSQRLLGLIIFLYGLAKLLLGSLLKIAPISSAHAVENTSYVYFLVSTLALFAGYRLMKHARNPNN